MAISSKNNEVNIIFTKTFLIYLEALGNIFTVQRALQFDEDIVLQAVGKAIANSRDWDGGRRERELKKLLKDQQNKRIAEA